MPRGRKKKVIWITHTAQKFFYYYLFIYFVLFLLGLDSESVLCIYGALNSLARSIISIKYVPYIQSMILIWFCLVIYILYLIFPRVIWGVKWVEGGWHFKCQVLTYRWFDTELKLLEQINLSSHNSSSSPTQAQKFTFYY